MRDQLRKFRARPALMRQLFHGADRSLLNDAPLVRRAASMVMADALNALLSHNRTRATAKVTIWACAELRQRASATRCRSRELRARSVTLCRGAAELRAHAQAALDPRAT